MSNCDQIFPDIHLHDELELLGGLVVLVLLEELVVLAELVLSTKV